MSAAPLPRAETLTEDELGRLLEVLEIPDLDECDCPQFGLEGEYEPCEHFQAKDRADLTLANWALYGLTYSTLILERLKLERGPPRKGVRQQPVVLEDNQDFFTRDLPACAQSSCSHTLRVDELYRRARAGEQIFHPAEFTSKETHSYPGGEGGDE